MPFLSTNYKENDRYLPNSSEVNSNFALTLGYPNPALDNPAQPF